MMPQERWIGFIDRIDPASIQGWGMDRESPMASVAVEAIGSGGGYVFGVAGLYRQDVEDGGYGTGHHGFELDISEFAQDELVTVRFFDGGPEITRAPIALDAVAGLLFGSLPDALLQAARDLARRIAKRHALLSKAGGDGRAEAMWDERLVAPHDPVSDPEGLVTRFAAHEASRLVRDGFDRAIGGSLQDRLGVLFWYVDTYAASRRYPARVPLGASQIAALNAPARLAGASDAVTVALFNFVLTHRPTHADLRDDRLLHEAVFWWCARQAVLHRLDDCLVTPDQIELLATIERGGGSSWPCTTFMMLYARHHPGLSGLDLTLPRDRLALLGYLILAAFVDPGLLRFLPGEAVRHLARGEDRRVLASVLGRLVSPGDRTTDDEPAGTNLLGQGEALLASAGRSLTARRFIGTAPLTVPPAAPGVLVIGPIAKSSGLGRAMRLSLDALAAIDEHVVAVDFDMDNPAAEECGDRPPKGSGRSDGPRDITLMHLNADVLPLAFAYGPRHLLSGTYRIGFFFWELTEIPECHKLALDLVDEIWTASAFNRELYARHTTKPVVRVGMAAPPLPDGPAAPRAARGLENGVFTFVAVFDSLSFIARKNPLGMIEAFQHAFPIGDEAVAFVLKTQNRGLVMDDWQVRTWRAIDRAVAADSRIVLVDETLAFPDLLALMRACDAYVSLHRSEGWGFGIVEAMQLGLPVICTGWSGNADFCTDETAFLVAHRLIPVGAGQYIHTPRGSLWADPSISSAATQMRIVASDKAAVSRKTRAASAYVAEHFGLNATARRYADRLAAIRGARGRVTGQGTC